MNTPESKSFLSRREFLRLAQFSALSVLPAAWGWYLPPNREDQLLSRVVDPAVDVHSRPDILSSITGQLDEDSVVVRLREVVGSNIYRINQRWVETSQGYIWSPQLQPVKNDLNSSLAELPASSRGPGLWVEVTVPYVDVLLDNPQPLAPRTKYLIANGRLPRLYYSQILWVDQLKVSEAGETWYRLIEPYGSYGDRFWGTAEAFKPIAPEEVQPISATVENKRIEVNLARQTLSCFEDDREIYFARISSGRVGQETPIGQHFQIYWKLVSVHMSAGTTGAGYDLVGVGWPTFFASGGIAIHSTFWHNDFGVPTSAGCVNAAPEDARFVSLWSSPRVPYDPGMIDIGSTGLPSTIVRVLEY